jgi:hypothetical protein
MQTKFHEPSSSFLPRRKFWGGGSIRWLMINKNPLMAPASPWRLLLLEANSPKLLFTPNVPTVLIFIRNIENNMPVDV